MGGVGGRERRVVVEMGCGDVVVAVCCDVVDADDDEDEAVELC